MNRIWMLSLRKSKEIEKIGSYSGQVNGRCKERLYALIQIRTTAEMKEMGSLAMNIKPNCFLIRMEMLELFVSTAETNTDWGIQTVFIQGLDQLSGLLKTDTNVSGMSN